MYPNNSTQSDSSKPYTVDFPRPDEFNLYVKTPMDFVVVCNYDFLAASILSILDRTTRNLSGSLEGDTWLTLSMTYLQNALFGSMDHRSIRRKIETLKNLGVVKIKSRKGLTPSVMVDYPALLEKCAAVYFPEKRTDSEPGPLLTESSITKNVIERTNCPFSEQSITTKVDNIIISIKSSIDNTSNITMSSFAGTETSTVLPEQLSFLPIGPEEEKTEQEEKSMGLDQVQSVLRVYHNGGSKHKADQYKKSVANLSARFGEQLQTIINEYGEEKTTDGIKAFMTDEFWMKNGLPIPAFLKTPWKWIESETGSGTAPTPRNVKRVNRRLPIAPATPNARESASGYLVSDPVSREQIPKEKLRAMRRNEAMMFFNACGSPLIAQFREATDAEKFDQMLDKDLDSWFDVACTEFKAIKRIDAPVTTKPVFVKSEEAV